MTESSPTRVLVLGATGMLGHKVWQVLRQRFDAWAAVRRVGRHRATGLYEGPQVIEDVTAENFSSVERAVAAARPHAIVNCIGIVKQLKAAHDAVQSIAINALFPHQMADLAAKSNARLIHISTDCVFSGTRGHYTEDDVADANDLYGRTKFLGEVAGDRCLTLRTSIVGRELSATTGLLEWFLGHRGGRVGGYTAAHFSGLTTLALARMIGDVIERVPALSGVYHVASEPISKYDLLIKFNRAFDAGTEIEPSDALRIDRTLNGGRFAAETGLSAGSWDTMVSELAADPTPYDDWRLERV
jgi:dTDP-4-dehydrorhamnose reductase